jgi:UDP-N-acetylglucosamine pyrophosphorylase
VDTPWADARGLVCAQVNILTFNQSRYPRFGKDSLMPVARAHNADKSLWYSRGEGRGGPGGSVCA